MTYYAVFIPLTVVRDLFVPLTCYLEHNDVTGCGTEEDRVLLYQVRELIETQFFLRENGEESLDIPYDELVDDGSFEEDDTSNYLNTDTLHYPHPDPAVTAALYDCCAAIHDTLTQNGHSLDTLCHIVPLDMRGTTAFIFTKEVKPYA